MLAETRNDPDANLAMRSSSVAPAIALSFTRPTVSGRQHRLGKLTIGRAQHAFAITGRSVMRVQATANSIELSVLRQVLDDHCREIGIEENSSIRNHLATRIMTLFMSGIHGLEQMKEALQKDRAM
jgi:hypothetical protein